MKSDWEVGLFHANDSNSRLSMPGQFWAFAYIGKKNKRSHDFKRGFGSLHAKYELCGLKIDRIPEIFVQIFLSIFLGSGGNPTSHPLRMLDQLLPTFNWKESYISTNLVLRHVSIPKCIIKFAPPWVATNFMFSTLSQFTIDVNLFLSLSSSWLRGKNIMEGW